MPTNSPFESAFPAGTVYESIGDATVPWRYSSVEHEYGALRGGAALFDLSACALIAVEGRGSEGLLTAVFTRELEFLSSETSIMGLLLDSDGVPVDLITVYRTDSGFLVETAVGRGTSTIEHLERTATAIANPASISRVDGEVLLGFEGPNAWTVAEALLDESVTGLPYQAVRPVTIDDVPVTISRTGFTGEFGFKIVAPREHAAAIWSRAAAAGAEPAGHEALEIAMTEFRQPLLHRELDDSPSIVVRSGLNWLIELEKDSFVGRDALIASRDDPSPLLPVCFVSDAPEVVAGAAIGSRDEVLGRIVHVVRSPEGGEWCGVAEVDADCAGSNLVFALHGADGPSGAVRTVSAPIRIPTSWGALLDDAWDADS